VGIARAAALESKRKYLRHAGQTLALSRMTARQCGHFRVVPAADCRVVLTRFGWSPA
jgi:hypothetical protein